MSRGALRAIPTRRYDPTLHTAPGTVDLPGADPHGAAR